MKAQFTSDFLTVHFTAEGEWTDYGVPRSPRWREPNPNTIDIEALEILGIEIEPKALFEHFPTLGDALLELSQEVEFEE